MYGTRSALAVLTQRLLSAALTPLPPRDKMVAANKDQATQATPMNAKGKAKAKAKTANAASVQATHTIAADLHSCAARV